MAKYVNGPNYIHTMEELLVKGGVVPSHRHNHDHTTIIHHGAALIEKLDDDGNVLRSVIKRASEMQNFVLIKAEDLHRLTSLEDGTLGMCVYAHRDDQGQVVEKFSGWDSPAYV